MHIRLRIEPFLPVISLRPLSPTVQLYDGDKEMSRSQLYFVVRIVHWRSGAATSGKRAADTRRPTAGAGCMSIVAANIAPKAAA